MGERRYGRTDAKAEGCFPYYSISGLSKTQSSCSSVEIRATDRGVYLDCCACGCFRHWCCGKFYDWSIFRLNHGILGLTIHNRNSARSGHLIGVPEREASQILAIYEERRERAIPIGVSVEGFRPSQGVVPSAASVAPSRKEGETRC